MEGLALEKEGDGVGSGGNLVCRFQGGRHVTGRGLKE